MSDVNGAICRLTSWLRDYGPGKNQVFVEDVATVMDAAKEAAEQQEEIERLRTQLERGKAHATERVAMIKENEQLRNELRHLQRKVEHGCAGFYCEDCDKGSEVSDETTRNV